MQKKGLYNIMGIEIKKIIDLFNIVENCINVV